MAIMKNDAVMKKPALTINELHTRLEGIAPGNSAYDAVQRGFILAMLERCSDKSDSAKQLILEKTTAALERYELGKLQTQAQTKTHKISSQQPQPNASEHSRLSVLIELLERNSLQTGTTSEDASLDEMMVNMDHVIVRAAAPKLAESNASPATKATKKTRNRKKLPATPAGPELKATRQARKIMAIDKALKMVDDINARQLENPGPLNPQMLTTQIITLMRDISPAYINRFLTQLDTIFWLEAD